MVAGVAASFVIPTTLILGKAIAGEFQVRAAIAQAEFNKLNNAASRSLLGVFLILPVVITYITTIPVILAFTVLDVFQRHVDGRSHSLSWLGMP